MVSPRLIDLEKNETLREKVEHAVATSMDENKWADYFMAIVDKLHEVTVVPFQFLSEKEADYQSTKWPSCKTAFYVRGEDKSVN